jgi:glycosyltransferase involved in cell wall biosynthesis
VLHSDEGHYYTIANKYKAQVDIFPCVSARVHKTLQGKCPDIAPARISTIPCGIQLPPVNKRTHTSDLLKLIYVGRITEYQKRVSDLVKIAQQLVKHNVAFELTIAGDGGADKTALEQKITGNSLDKYVRFTGWLAKDKVQEYLYESDVMVLTSDFEGTPISMMEALASGCGFTGTRVSGIEDCEDHPAAADCFRIYGVGDIEDAAAKIQQIAAIPLQTRQLAARRIAESEFSMDTCLDRYLAAIATIKTKEYVMTTTTLPPAALIKSRLTAELRALKMKLRG